MVYFVGKWCSLLRTLLQSSSFLSLDRFGLGGVWCSQCPGVQQGGGHGKLAAHGICLLAWLGTPLVQTALAGVGPGLRYRPSPGFHQKVGIRSPQERVFFQVHAEV